MTISDDDISIDEGGGDEGNEKGTKATRFRSRKLGIELGRLVIK